MPTTQDRRIEGHAGIWMKLAGRVQPLRLGERDAPSVSSAGTPWRGVPFELHRMLTTRPPPRGEAIEAGPLAGEHGVLVILEGEIAITCRDGARTVRSVGRPGAVKLLSGDAPQRLVRLEGSARAAAINVSPAWLERLELSGRWQPRAFGDDRATHGFAQTMRAEIAGGARSGPLFADALSLALLGHIAARHGFGGAARERTRGQLTPVQRDRLRELVQARIGSDLTLTTLSAEVGVSPRHFGTLFRRAFGITPHRYVLEQRIAAAERMLAAGERDLAAIALAVGFSSQSHFTTAFRAARGLTPARFARVGRCVI